MATWPRPQLPEARARRRQLGRSFRAGRRVSGRAAAMDGDPPPVEERRRLREELSEFVENCCRTLEEVTASLGWSLDRLDPGEEEAAEVRGAGSSRGPSACGAPGGGRGPASAGLWAARDPACSARRPRDARTHPRAAHPCGTSP